MINIWNLLFPKICGGCGKWGSYLCSSCITQITQTELVCPVCERPAMGGKTHPLCQKKYGLDGLWSLGIYQGVLRKAIQKLKYRFVEEMAASLVNLMIEYWAKYSPYFLKEINQEWVIVPVPLYQKRQNWRGFNQSKVIGQILSNSLGLAYCDGLKRTRQTKAQVTLKSWQRKKNIHGAFSLTTNHELSTKNILLLDDVWTTGSTLKECCYILKKGGANKVWAITLAR